MLILVLQLLLQAGHIEVLSIVVRVWGEIEHSNLHLCVTLPVTVYI